VEEEEFFTMISGEILRVLGVSLGLGDCRDEGCAMNPEKSKRGPILCLKCKGQWLESLRASGS
jgi:predicted Zn-dependent protease